MPSPKVLFIILALGATALLERLLALYRWHVDKQVLIDTQTNGGVSVANGSHARVVQR
jgi:hypothetical protein